MQRRGPGSRGAEKNGVGSREASAKEKGDGGAKWDIVIRFSKYAKHLAHRQQLNTFLKLIFPRKQLL